MRVGFALVDTPLVTFGIWYALYLPAGTLCCLRCLRCQLASDPNHLYHGPLELYLLIGSYCTHQTSPASRRRPSTALYWDARHIDEGVTFLKQRAQPHA